MTARGWTCRRVTNHVPCQHHNPPRTRKCQACGKPRPARKRSAHFDALKLDYAEYIELNGGEHCGICGTGPTVNRRLDRDHDHRSGIPRGLLCHFCNRLLAPRITVEWLERAIAYLRRTREAS